MIVAPSKRRRRKRRPVLGEFCVVHADGSVTDAELHEPILAAGDEEKHVQATRERLLKKGFAPEDVYRLFPRKLAAPAKETGGPHSSETGIDGTETVYLVSCVAKKQDHACKAADLYVSQWFRKARAYVEATRCPWFILSAEYGLLKPSCVVEPYNKTLNRMTRPERQDWAKRVIAQMEADLPSAECIVVLAGARYREFLLDYLRSRVRTVEVPMQGLPIGKQLQFLKRGLTDVRV
jgi:hypothetical protein